MTQPHDSASGLGFATPAQLGFKISSFQVLDCVRAMLKQNDTIQAVNNVQGPVLHINNVARNKNILTKSLMALVFSLMAAAAIVPAYIKYGSHSIDDQVREHLRAASLINITLLNLVFPCIVYFKCKGLRRHVKESVESLLGL